MESRFGFFQILSKRTRNKWTYFLFRDVDSFFNSFFYVSTNLGSFLRHRTEQTLCFSVIALVLWFQDHVFLLLGYLGFQSINLLSHVDEFPKIAIFKSLVMKTTIETVSKTQSTHLLLQTLCHGRTSGLVANFDNYNSFSEQ